MPCFTGAAFGSLPLSALSPCWSRCPGKRKSLPPPPATTDAPKPDGSPATPTPAAPDAGAPAARPDRLGRRPRSAGETDGAQAESRAAPGPRPVSAPRRVAPTVNVPPPAATPLPSATSASQPGPGSLPQAAGTDHHHGERRAHQERARLHRPGPAAGKPRRLLQAGQRPARPRHFHSRLQRPQRLRHPQHRRARGRISGDAAGRPLPHRPHRPACLWRRRCLSRPFVGDVRQLCHRRRDQLPPLARRRDQRRALRDRGRQLRLPEQLRHHRRQERHLRGRGIRQRCARRRLYQPQLVQYPDHQRARHLRGDAQ